MTKKTVGYPDDNPKTAVGVAKPAVFDVPPIALLQIGAAMVDGAAKYGHFNWREHTVSVSVYANAIYRHLLAYLDGENNARDSGLSHLAHIAACCAILMDADDRNKLKDDRGLPGGAADYIERKTVKPHVELPDSFRLPTGVPGLALLGGGLSVKNQPVEGKRKKVYLAGPMTGLPDFNYPAFHKAAAKLRAEGYYVYNPAEIAEDYGGTEGFDVRQGFAEYTRIICEECDGVMMLPGWEKSTGATAEHALATALKLEITYLAEGVKV